MRGDANGSAQSFATFSSLRRSFRRRWDSEMKNQKIRATLIVAASVFIGSVVLAAQDRFNVKSPNGIAFSEFKGYDAWQVIAPSQTDEAAGCMTGKCVKVISGNAAMIKAYIAGIPANGKSVPDGAAIAKIEWSKESDTTSPYAVTVPGPLNDISFMVKDSKRFPDTNGWGYAQFRYDKTSGTFKPFGNGAGFAKATCHQCHINGAKSHDYVYTKYAQR
jgi:hypothetical protein